MGAPDRLRKSFTWPIIDDDAKHRIVVEEDNGEKARMVESHVDAILAVGGVSHTASCWRVIGLARRETPGL